MKIIRFIWLSVWLAHNRWALREIDPMHKDLPDLLRESLEYEDQLRGLFA